MTNNKILTEKEIEKAIAEMDWQSRGLSQVCENIKHRFKKQNLHEFFVLDSSETYFGAFVFFETRLQIEQAKQSGLVERIKEEVFREMEKAGRGIPMEIRVDFEFDSHENVVENYEGDYFNRLR